MTAPTPGQAFEIRLNDPQGQLLAEIAEPATTIRSLTLTYAFALREPDVDWPTVNKAIAARWSMRALSKIKADAWKKVELKAAQP